MITHLTSIAYDPTSGAKMRSSFPRTPADVEINNIIAHALTMQYDIVITNINFDLIELELTEANKHKSTVQIFTNDLQVCSCEQYHKIGVGYCKHIAVVDAVSKHPSTIDERLFAKTLIRGKSKLNKFKSIKYVIYDSFKGANVALGSGPVEKKAVSCATNEKHLATLNTLGSVIKVSLPSPYIIKDGISLYDYQHDILENMLTAKRAVCSMVMGAGKAQVLDAKILTPTGWTTMGEVKIGDVVIGRSGDGTKITGVYPQGYKDVYKVIFSDGSSTTCCAEHLWAVRTPQDKYKNKPYRIMSLLEILKSGVVDKFGNKKYSIPMVDIVNFDAKDIKIDPYLLGLILGDGCISSKSISISTDDDFIKSYVIESLPYNLKLRQKSKYDFTISSDSNRNLLSYYLRYYGLMGKKSNYKFIPDDYKYNTKEVRLSVLQGLMDTDGFCSKDGKDVIFYSTSEQLARDVQELVWSFGGKAVITDKQTYFNYLGEHKAGLPSYAIHISLPPSIVPFKLPRKLARFKPRTKYLPNRYISKIEYAGRQQAQCISVDAPDHLYTTDDYIITHNTLTSIAGLKHLGVEGMKVFIVCPKSIVKQWANEIKRVLGIDAFQITSQNVLTFTDLCETGIGIATYQTMVRNIDKLASSPYSMVIADEIQYIKNEESKTWNALKRIESEYFWGLSGTVIENRLDDLYNIMQIISPGLLGPKWKFDFKFKKLGSIHRKKVLYQNEIQNLPDLRSIISNNIFSYDKIALPSIFHHKYLVGMDPGARSTHDEFIEKANTLISKSLNMELSHFEKLLIQSYLLKARQACNSVELINKVIAPRGEKIKNILDVIKQVCLTQGEKLVIFSEWTEMLDIIEREMLLDMSINHVRFDGSMTAKARMRAIEQFKNDPLCMIFFSSDAGGIGIDGLQLVCNNMLHVELPWNPGKLAQRNGRLHRLLQTKDVNVYYMITEKSIEEKMQKLLDDKAKIRMDALF